MVQPTLDRSLYMRQVMATLAAKTNHEFSCHIFSPHDTFDLSPFSPRYSGAVMDKKGCAKPEGNAFRGRYMCNPVISRHGNIY